MELKFIFHSCSITNCNFSLSVINWYELRLHVLAKISHYEVSCRDSTSSKHTEYNALKMLHSLYKLPMNQYIYIMFYTGIKFCGHVIP